MKIYKKIPATIEAYRVCDVCGSKKHIKSCIGCDIDICWSCAIIENRDFWDDYDFGDSSEYICGSCYEKREKYEGDLKNIGVSQQIVDKSLESLKQRWKKDCLELPKTTSLK